MANNDQADLRGKLETQIGEDHGSTTEVWTTAELNFLVDRAVDSLWPRFSRPLNPDATTIASLDNTYFYALPAAVMAVSRIDILDASAVPVGSIPGRSWEITGEPLNNTGKLHISPSFASTGNTFQLVGYGRYDTATNLIPNDYAPLTLARARAEAYRRIARDRERFQAWLSRNQVQNVSVNELLQMINEADAEANRLSVQTPRVWQKPVPGYTG